MPVDPDYQIVCGYLKALNIHFSPGWVSESIHNIKSTSFAISSNDLKKLVYEKWLSSNLRDFKVGSLPSNITSFGKISLSGTYAVQVESMVNSARSCYSELQKIENPAKCVDISEKSDEDNNSKRCLTFVLCDGVQEVQAMEYQFIPSIRLNDPDFLPGFKMVIKGPVVCRKGMLLLKQENVKVCGGKVESLCETNNLTSLLRRTLGLSTDNEQSNSHPQTVISDGSSFCTSQNVQPIERRQHIETSNNISDSAMEMDELLSQHDDILLGLTFESGFEDELMEDNSRGNVQNDENCFDVPKKPRTNSYHNIVMQENVKSHSLNNNSVSVNENMEENYASNKKLKLESELLNYASTSRSSKTNEITQGIPNAFSDIDDIIMDDDVIFESQYCTNKTSSQTSGKCTQMKMSSYLTNCKTQSTKAVPVAASSNSVQERTPKHVTSYPFVYLKQIEEIGLTKPVTFTVKAIILTLKSKISIRNDEFILKASISDGSSTVQVDFSTEMVENIMEYSPCEVKSMMNDKNKNSAVAGRLKDIFVSAQQKLLSMNCLMEIKFFNDGTSPLIVGLEEVNFEHVNALKARCS